MWTFVINACFVMVLATFELHRVSPVVTRTVRSALCITACMICRLRLACVAPGREREDVPDGVLILDKTEFSMPLVMDLLGNMSLLQAAHLIVAIPECLMHTYLIATVSSLCNAVTVPNHGYMACTEHKVMLIFLCKESRSAIDNIRSKRYIVSSPIMFHEYVERGHDD